jgi:hypothetical protein
MPLFNPTSGGGAAWQLVNQTGVPITSGSTWTYSVDVANVDVVNLSPYNELLIFARSVTASAGTGVRIIRASTDNGATFFAGASDYSVIAATGAGSNSSAFMGHSTATNLARNIVGQIANLKGSEKMSVAMAGEVRIPIGFSADINAIRLTDSTGSNLTGGSLYVYAR